jgi:hypothetical protein
MIAKVEKCFANTFCKIQDYKCLGKDTNMLQDKLNKLFFAHWLLSCGVEDCTIECFVNKNCNC